MGVEDENLAERCPHCSGRHPYDIYACRPEFPVIADIISWNSQGFIRKAEMRRTYEGGDGMNTETYHVVLTINRGKRERSKQAS